MRRTNKENKIKQLMSAGECHALCLRLLDRKLYTASELRAKLLERGAEADIAEQVIAELETAGYVNDRHFAEALIHYKGDLMKHGVFDLRRELRRRGVDDYIAEDILQNEFIGEPEAEAAYQLLRSRIKRYMNAVDGDNYFLENNLTEDESSDVDFANDDAFDMDNFSIPKDKLYALMRRRGFSSNAVSAAFERLMNENSEEN